MRRSLKRAKVQFEKENNLMDDDDLLFKIKALLDEHLAEEADRPTRRELALRSTAEMYYPNAKKNVGGELKTQGKYRKNYPEGAIIHFTDGRDDPINGIEHAKTEGYCYFLVATNGDVYQNFPLSRWGSHAGKSTWPGLGSFVSQYLVGIEVITSGKLRQLPNGKFRPWYNEEDYLKQLNPPRTPKPADDLDPSQVRHVDKKANRKEGWYEKFTDLQESSLKALLQWLKSNNPDVFSYDLVLGHDEVAPARRDDPGGALSMTMPEFRALLKSE
jgi:N-acetyl-anhydromuramyl-L-alanine amidase AmpD